MKDGSTYMSRIVKELIRARVSTSRQRSVIDNECNSQPWKVFQIDTVENMRIQAHRQKKVACLSSFIIVPLLYYEELVKKGIFGSMHVRRKEDRRWGKSRGICKRKTECHGERAEKISTTVQRGEKIRRRHHPQATNKLGRDTQDVGDFDYAVHALLGRFCAAVGEPPVDFAISV